MKRLLLETILSFATGVLVLYAAVTSLSGLGEGHSPGVEAMPAASHQAASVRCNACFALARREGY